jgi:hypothetical protein
MTKRKYPKSDDNRKRELIDGPAYVSWANEDDQQQAFETYAQALEEASYSVANYRRDFSDITSYADGRPGLRGADFDWFRPGQAAPTLSKDIMAYARYVYRRVGLIHNAIDLMGDFAGQGVRLVHQNPQVERFYNDWFSIVGGKKVTERLGHLLFREANVPLRFFMAKVNKVKRLEMQKTVADTEVRTDIDTTRSLRNEIPWRYTFIDPLLVEPVGGALANLSKHKVLSLKVPLNLKRQIDNIKLSRDPEVRKVLENISPDILKAVDSNSDIILPPDKTRLYHYKKDDWQAWADPITYSAFEPLNLYQRLQLADKAALDGAISKIRVWKLGNLEHKLAPTPTASSTLADMLGANVGGGTIDIIWGPDIELIETSSDVQAFLGEEKYKPTLMAIYATLGIPPTLTGTFGASGTTNNFISLKTLTERLNYVREIIVEFWTEQVQLVQKAMGFRFPAQIEFDYMYLDDPAAMATLLLNMADRNIVSDEFVQRHIKAKPKIEERRVTNEDKKREKKGAEKVSPYHQVDQDHALKKIALQTGQSSPSEVGLELETRKTGEKSLMDLKEQQIVKQAQMKPKPASTTNTKTGTPGRPKNSKDSAPRKQKTFKPKSKAAIETWAKQAQTKVSEIVNPIILAGFSKSTLRNLTSEEFRELEEVKFEILCNLNMEHEINEDSVAAASKRPLKEIHSEFLEWIQETEATIKSKLTIDQIRDLRALYYVYHNYSGNF